MLLCILSQNILMVCMFFRYYILDIICDMLDVLEIYLAVFKAHNTNQQSPTFTDSLSPVQFYSTQLIALSNLSLTVHQFTNYPAS